VVAGTNNWVPFGSTGVPLEWRRTIFGLDARLASPRDPRPMPDSPLVGAGATDPLGAPRFEFPSPLRAPRELPPRGSLERVGTAVQRLSAVDIGAFPCPGEGPPSPTAPDAPLPPTLPAPPPTRPMGCACRALAHARESLGAAFGALVVAVITPARRRRRT
jgi:hypothetical protein